MPKLIFPIYLFTLLTVFAIAGCGGGGGQSPKSIFDDPTCINSPHGDITEYQKAYSPDGTRYAQELKPTSNGNIGIYDTKTSSLLTQFHIETGSPNYLKAMAWSRDGGYIAVMYHGSYAPFAQYYGANLYEVTTGKLTRHITDDQAHCMVFSQDNTLVILADTYSGPVTKYPSGLTPI